MNNTTRTEQVITKEISNLNEVRLKIHQMRDGEKISALAYGEVEGQLFQEVRELFDELDALEDPMPMKWVEIPLCV